MIQKKKYVVSNAEMEANKRGRSEANVKSKLKTSIAKMMAAIGALKIAEIAAAAAHPISKLRVA